MGLGETSNVARPTLISQLSDIDVCMLSAGETHMAALTKRGELYLWGDNGDNILGFGCTVDTSIPRKLSLPGLFFTSICCGFRHTFAVTHDKKLYSWGYARHGVLGGGSERIVIQPTEVTKFLKAESEIEETPKIEKICSGGMHAAVLTDRGEVYSWGEGRYYKTCQATERDIARPSFVSSVSLVSSDISCSSGSTVIFQGKLT